jgi:cytochrome bd-type quinol oxidase subunit 2
LTRATRVGVALAGFLLVVLGASGAWLWWNYRPDQDEWIRTVHQVAAVAILVVAVALVVLAIVRRASGGAAGIVASVGVLVTTGGAYVIGRLLPWDQLALSAVIAPKDFPYGIDVTFDDRVKFILLRSREVSPSTYHWWAIAHLVLSVLVVLALVMVWLRARARVVSPPSPAPEGVPEL